MKLTKHIHFSAAVARLLVAVAIVFVAGGCTQNDGHIGKLFGSWNVNEITIDGQVVALPEGDYSTMSFQSDIVVVMLADNLHNVRKNLGTWRCFDSVLQFDFTHKGTDVEPGTGPYAAPEWLHFPAGVSEFVIVELSGRKLEFTRVDKDGREYVYKLNKTW